MAGGKPLTDAQMTYFDTQVTDVARQMIIGRNLIALAPGSPLGFGVQKIDFHALVDMSAAEISMKLSENSDVIGLTNDSLPIPVIHKEFEIDRRDLASSKRSGMPLDTTSAEASAELVAVEEDTLILQGWAPDGSTYDFDGLYQAANNDYSTSKDFGTAGNATLALKGSIALLLADKIYPPYNMTLNSVQWSEILAPRSTSSDRTEMDVLKDMLAGGDGSGARTQVTGVGGTGGGNLFVSDVITDGTGLVSAAPNTRYADLVIAADLQTEFETLQKSKNVFGRVFESMIPRIKQPNAFCKMSNI